MQDTPPKDHQTESPPSLTASDHTGDLLSMAAHQLRTPTTSIRHHLQMVLEGFCGPVTDSQKMELQGAKDSSDRLLNIIETFLHLTNIDSSSLSMKYRDCDICELVTSIVTEQKQLFDNRSQTLTCLTDEPIVVSADGHYLRMAIENIIENASKYSSQGKNITVDVATEKGKAIISIIDEGIGIDPEYIKHIFSKFGRINSSPTAGKQGTGLGLYWSKQIIDLHSGTIAVQSTLGTGTSFTIAIPLVQKESD